LEVEQLLAALTRPPGRERAAPDLTALDFREVRGDVTVMSASAWQATLRRELSAAERIPYTAHVSPHVVRTALGDYVQVFRLGGASFECADDDTLNSWHERLNIFWRNVASPQLALWVHVIRRREVTALKPGEAGFAGALETKYRTRLGRQTLMVNELYLSTVYRPTAGVRPDWHQGY